MSEYESLRTDLDGLAGSMERYSGAVNIFSEAATREIKKLWADNAELRDDLHAVSNRLEALTSFVTSHPAEVAAKIVNDANRRTLREVTRDE